MRGHECYHCKQWIAAGEPHDCWTTTEAALTAELSDDLREAWERLRESAVEIGEQRIYASHHSIMFARKVCYFFVRPRRNWLDVCVMLDRAPVHPLVKTVHNPDKPKKGVMLRVTHRDQVEAPLTDWLRQAYEFSEQPKKGSAKKVTKAAKKTVKKTST